MKSLLVVGFMVWYTEALICTIGQERDPESGFRYRWVIPVPDPCQCTKLSIGGLNTRAPYRPFVVTYMDTFIYSHDQEEIRTWLNCTNTLLKHLILYQSFAQNENYGLCEGTPANITEYTLRGDVNLVNMVPGPDVADHACAVYTQAGSYLDIGDFKDTCISDPGLCESMTWSLWLKIDTSSGFTGERYYISSGGQTRHARGIALLYKSQDEMFYFHVHTAKNKFYNGYNKPKLPLDTWFHLGIAIEMNQKIVKVLKLYVDGEIRLEDINDIKNEGILVDRCTKLYLGMGNTCFNPDPIYERTGSAAYSNLMVFDRLLNQDMIKNLKTSKLLKISNTQNTRK